MSDFFLKSGAGAIVYSNRAWSTGEKMVPALNDGSSATELALARTAVWECTTAGTSTGTPVWLGTVTYDVTTLTQNGVVWTARKPGYSSGATVDWAFSTIYLWYLVVAMNAEGAGARGLVSDAHAESSTTPMAFTGTGTITAPYQIICVDDAATSGFTAATTAVCTTTGAAGWSITNGCWYFYGITFNNGSGASGANFVLANGGTGGLYRFERCAIKMVATGATLLAMSSTSLTTPCLVEFYNVDLSFGTTTQRFIPLRCKFNWYGGSILSGSATPSSLFSWNTGSVMGDVYIDGVDFSNFAATFNFCLAQPNGAGSLVATRCKLPTSWSGGVYSAAPTVPGHRAELDNVSATDTNYQKWIEDCYGSVRESTTVVITGGATDGTTQKSWKMATTALAGTRRGGLVGNWGTIWNETIGGALTATIALVSNSAALLTNAEMYLDLTHLGTSGFSLATLASGAPATPVLAASNLSAQTTAWNTAAPARANSTAYSVGDAIQVSSNRIWFCTTAGTTAGSLPGGYASAVDGDSITDNTAVFRAGWRQIMTVTFTPQEKGPIFWRPVLCKASTTVYVDRKIAVA